MKADLVADVGNSRIKWGLCLANRIGDVATLSPENSTEWQQQSDAWRITSEAHWVVAGVHPARRDALVQWIMARGSHVSVLDSSRQLPIKVLVNAPDRVGIDRLLNAVAARHRCSKGKGAVIIDAGSAVTVDWVDEAGAFAGGAIFPGVRL